MCKGLTCTVGLSLASGIDGLLAHLTLHFILAIFTARIVSITAMGGGAKQKERERSQMVNRNSIATKKLFYISKTSISHTPSTRLHPPPQPRQRSEGRLTHLHLALPRSLHSDVQQRSLLMCSSPGSHSSPSSTREFPHTLMFLSRKHTGALALRRFTMELLLQLENS